MRPVTISFDHVLRLSDDTGLLEHAKGSLPRREHGYCLDDVARGLVVVSRDDDPSAELVQLADRYLAFVAHAQGPSGAFRNRLGYNRVWLDQPQVGDWWGRALWGLGSVVSGHGRPGQRREALDRFALGSQLRSPWPRATAFSMLGAAEVLRVLPDHVGARQLLIDGLAVLPGPADDPLWRWPETRLSYANAAMAEALVAAGLVLGEAGPVQAGIDLLIWLLELQTSEGRLSVVPAAGWGPRDHGPRFDQQPIEVAALADACATALRATGDERWRLEVERCVAWWAGANDVGALMHDETTGGGFDGLTPDGPNLNQGAESTVAWLTAQQHARRLGSYRLPGPP